MKRFLFVGLLSLWLCSCGNGNKVEKEVGEEKEAKAATEVKGESESEEIIEVERMASYDRAIEENDMYTEDKDDMLVSMGLVELDSVFYTDGSTAVYRMAYGPMNSLLEICDKEGRVMATCARASECCEQGWVYNYDEQGRLCNLLDLRYDDYDSFQVLDFCDSDSLGYIYWFGKYGEEFSERDNSEESYKTFRNRIEKIDYSRPDTARYVQINIEYDQDGDAVRVYQMWGDHEIKAPEGYKLNVSVEQGVSFWQSDINGGFYCLKIESLPKNKAIKEYTQFRYANLTPVVEENYRDGKIVRAVVYPKYENSSKVTVTMEEKGDVHIYSRQCGDEKERTLKFWKNGNLIKEQNLSAYGTVLWERSYIYSLPSTLVKYEEYKIDYSKKNTLKLEETGTVQLSEMDKECDEMNVLKHYSDWENEYMEV